MHIVIAHYTESLDWVNDIPKKYTISVYHKGPGGDTPNIGRESHTYLKYIVDNYENLPKSVVFLQADPFDHLPIENQVSIQHWLENWEETIDHTGLSQNLMTVHTLPTFRITPWLKELEANKVSLGLDNLELPDKFEATLRIADEIVPQHEDLDFGSWFAKYIDQDANIDYPNILMYFGACFGVSRERILLRSKEYYQRLLEQHTNVTPEETYYIERAWFYVFKGQLSSVPFDSAHYS